MRVLVNMQYYQGRSIRGLSLFHAIQDYIEGWTSLREDLFVYVLMPKRTGQSPKWDYSDSDLPNERSVMLEARPFGIMAGETTVNPNINLVPSPEEAQYHFPRMLNWYYDVCLDLRTLHVPHLKIILNHEVQQKSQYTPVVMLCHDAVIKGKEDHYSDDYAKMELYNMLQADDIVFYTANDRSTVAMENARQWASPAQVRWILGRTVSMVPMEFSRIDAHADEFEKKRSKREKLVLGYFASFWKAKRHEKIMAIFDKLHARYDLNMVVTSMKKKLPEVMNKDWVTFYSECGRDQYIPKLGDSDIVIVGSQHETGGRGYWEALMAGNVLIVKREPWNEEFVPDWYPYVGETWEEVEVLTFDAVKNISKARIESRKLAQHIRALVHYEKSANVILDAFDGVIPPPRKYSSGGSIATLVREAVESVASRSDSFSMIDVDLETQKLSSNGMRLLESKYMIPKTLCKMIEFYGFKDTYKTAIPEFVPK